MNPQFHDGGLLTRVVNEVILCVTGWAARGKLDVGWDVHHSDLLHFRNNLLKYRRGVDVLERDMVVSGTESSSIGLVESSHFKGGLRSAGAPYTLATAAVEDMLRLHI